MGVLGRLSSRAIGRHSLLATRHKQGQVVVDHYEVLAFANLCLNGPEIREKDKTARCRR